MFFFLDNERACTYVFRIVKNVAVIEAAMKRRGLKRADLARITGIHGGLIGRYLRGETAVGVKNAPLIARALGLTPAQVLFGASA